MEEYWFCGYFPDTTIIKEQLTEEQEKIIEEVEKKTDNMEFLKNGWLGYRVNNGWKFMKHGMPVEYVMDERSNVARNILYERLEEKYNESVT